MKLTRSYKLPIYPNFYKFEDLRYSSSRYSLFLRHFLIQFFYKPFVKSFSTAGMGRLANIAQRRASGIVKGIRNRDGKSNCPEVNFESCPASISKSKNSSFDFWVTVTSQWKNMVKIPTKSYKKLNQKLKSGWKLSKYCELFKNKKTGCWMAKVFVSKQVEKPKPKNEFLGVDVGIKYGVARSDKYLGRNLDEIIKKERQSQAERQRQKHPKKQSKTKVKQQLDIEVNRALVRCKSDSLNLVVEHPKVLANLKIDKWARSYFARRASERAQEEEVYVVWINPAYTSVICSVCGVLDKQSRVNRALFKCTSCSQESHADINAARNIARKGQEGLLKRRRTIWA